MPDSKEELARLEYAILRRFSELIFEYLPSPEREKVDLPFERAYQTALRREPKLYSDYLNTHNKLAALGVPSLPFVVILPRELDTFLRLYEETFGVIERQFGHNYGTEDTLYENWYPADMDKSRRTGSLSIMQEKVRDYLSTRPMLASRFSAFHGARAVLSEDTVYVLLEIRKGERRMFGKDYVRPNPR